MEMGVAGSVSGGGRGKIRKIRRGEITELLSRRSFVLERANLPSNSLICKICATRIS